MFCDLRCGNCLGEDAIPTICVDLIHLTHLNEGTAVRTAVRTETDLTNSKNSMDWTRVFFCFYFNGFIEKSITGRRSDPLGMCNFNAYSFQ